MAVDADNFPGISCYTIAFTVRSGSNLLCDLLSRNGFGHPAEYFQPPLGVTNRHWYEQLDAEPNDFETFIRRLVPHRAHHGLFGAKLAWDHKNALIEQLASTFNPEIARPEQFFARHTWLYVRRRDRFAQAVSAWVAQQTGAWSSDTTSTATPPLEYDFFGIFTCFFSLLVEDYLWDDYFASTGQQPIRVWYEDLVGDPATHLWPVFEALSALCGQEPPDPASLVYLSRLEKQGNAQSREFAHRLAEDLHRIGTTAHWQAREGQLTNWLRFFSQRGWNGPES